MPLPQNEPIRDEINYLPEAVRFMPIAAPACWVIQGLPGLWVHKTSLWAAELDVEDQVQAKYLRDGKTCKTWFLRLLPLERKLLAVIKDDQEPPIDQVICDVCGMPSPSMTETVDKYVVCQACIAHTPHRRAHAISEAL